MTSATMTRTPPRAVNRALRLMAVKEALEGGESFTRHSLGERFGISTRQAERDLDDLSGIVALVEDDAGTFSLWRG